MTGFPMDFADFANGQRIDIVCTLKVFDHTHGSHLMTLLNGCDFQLDGLLEVGFESYTILGCCLSCQFPVPKVFTDDKSKILSHSKPSWDGLHSLIDLCSGFGGLAQGAIAAGMHVSVAVDQNPKMLALYGKISEATKICRDFGRPEVLVDIWQHAKGAKVLSSGFSCQPYSRLGDGRSEHDTRSNCITKTLAAAYYLQVKAVILECVSPAGQDQFVCVRN